MSSATTNDINKTSLTTRSMSQSINNDSSTKIVKNESIDVKEEYESSSKDNQIDGSTDQSETRLSINKIQRKYIKKTNTEGSCSYKGGKWTQEEENKYYEFVSETIKRDPLYSQCSSNKKRRNFFIEMSRYIGTRSAIQCKSHDQKAFRRPGTSDSRNKEKSKKNNEDIDGNEASKSQEHISEVKIEAQNQDFRIKFEEETQPTRTIEESNDKKSPASTVNIIDLNSMMKIKIEELSENEKAINPFFRTSISKREYLELLHTSFQFNIWKKKLIELSQNKSFDILVNTKP